MADGDIVASGTVEVEWIVREWPQDDGSVLYDWIAAGDSDDLYETVEEARAEAIRSLSY